MRNYLLLIFVICIISLEINAQAPKIKFGKVSQKELEMKVYEKDPSADALVLFNKGELHFNYNNYEKPRGFQYEYTEHLRIKIFNKNAYDLANNHIELFHKFGREQKLKGFKAYTYNLENGKIVKDKIGMGDINWEKYSDNIDKGTYMLPNVKEGSVLDIEYTISSDYIYYLKSWQFQYTIPVVWSEYELLIPEWFVYSRNFNGVHSLETNERSTSAETFTIQYDKEASERSTGSFSNRSGEFTMDSQSNYFKMAAKDIPAFEREPYMPTSENYIYEVNFELAYEQFPGRSIKNYSTTWESVGKESMTDPNFGLELKKGVSSKIITEIIDELDSEQDKMVKILSYIQSNFKWDERNRKFLNNTLNEVLRDKHGSSGEINLLLTAMLQKAGLNANPVLISTKSNGMVNKNQPGIDQFNYTICHVLIDNKSYLLDGTDKYSYPNFLPVRCLNGQGLLITDQFSDWIDLTPKFVSKKVVGGSFTINDEGNIDGKLNETRNNYYALSFRKGLENYTDFEEYITEYQDKNQDVEISEYDISGEDNLNEPIKTNYTTIISEQVEEFNNLLVINPLNIYTENDNPFNSETRKYPIYFDYPSENLYVMNFQIPEGFEVDEIPESIQFSTPDKKASFLYQVFHSGNIIQVKCKKTMLKTFYLPDEYKILQNFYNQLINKHSEKIVLKKVI